ncbi:MAG TPA: T9SS type A sorting domain-containing protein, partial [Patescibacteria group bacterium]|nr:T9SS type A sorting domain-containing protein [Patescibacteria group bacterium]
RIGPSDTLALNIDFSASKDGFYIDSIILTSSGTPYTIPLGVNVVTIAAGIEEDQGKEVGIFPNPVTGITRITLPNFTGNTVIVKIYDMLGNEVVNFPQNQLQQEFHFNSKEIANGRYYIHFTDGQRTSVQSFIIWN